GSSRLKKGSGMVDGLTSQESSGDSSLSYFSICSARVPSPLDRGGPSVLNAVSPSVTTGFWSNCEGGIRMSFDLQPILKGELLELRPLGAEDFPDLYAVASDPLIWEQHPIKDRYKEEVFQVFFREALESGGALIAIDSRDGQVIGSSRFHGYDQERSEIEIGWTFLARSHWGGIYNREMKQLMLRHAFRFVNSVVFLIDPQNLRSQRAVEKIGGVRVGSRLDGGGRDSLVYRITASTLAREG